MYVTRRNTSFHRLVNQKKTALKRSRFQCVVSRIVIISIVSSRVRRVAHSVCNHQPIQGDAWCNNAVSIALRSAMSRIWSSVVFSTHEGFEVEILGREQPAFGHHNRAAHAIDQL